MASSRGGRAAGSAAKTARDVMRSTVISIGPDMPLTKVGQLFVEEGIHGAPVVDETERLLGVVSTMDLLRGAWEDVESPRFDAEWLREALELSSPDWSSEPGTFQDKLSQLTAADVMQTSVVTVTEDAPVSEVARALRQNEIHRVLVVRDDVFVGIVSSLDLVALLE